MPQPKKDTNRIAKVNSFIQQELGPILREFQEKQEGLLTITKVETSRDMRWAKVWLSIFGGDDNKILDGLKRNIYHIQGELNKKFTSKIVPRLQFFLDTTPRHAQHIDELIRKIHEEDDRGQ